MGCFCREAIQALRDDDHEPDPEAEPPPTVEPDALLSSISTWLATRWLPAPEWEPDPEWLEEELPEPPMPPESLAVVTALVHAYRSCAEDGIDLKQPDQKKKLARIVGTLNRRMQDLQPFEDDPRPWAAIATLNDQTDAVRTAIEQRLLLPPEEQEPEPPLAPWRALIVKVKAIAPLVAVGQLSQIDLADPDAPDELAKLVRTLRQVELPPLQDPARVLRVITRMAAVARLQRSLGADPARVPFERVLAAVQRKAEAVKKLLPDSIHLVADQLQGLPPTQPNPAALVNAETIAAARRIPPEVLEQLQWEPPPFEAFPLLTAGVPAMTLGRLMTRPGPPVIRTAPCGHACDAGTVMRALDTATGSPGTGTGAAPGG